MSVICTNSSACTWGLVVGSDWVSHSWSCWNVPVTQLDYGEGQGPHCIQQIIHYVIQAYCSSVVYCPIEQHLGDQTHLWCLSAWWFDFCISLSCHKFCCIFQSYWSELLGVTVCGNGTSACGSVVMQRMRGKSLTRQWLCCTLLGGYFPCVVRGFSKCCQLNPVSCWLGECLIHLLGRYCQLFQCEISHHSTSVKVQEVKLQNGWLP